MKAIMRLQFLCCLLTLLCLTTANAIPVGGTALYADPLAMAGQSGLKFFTNIQGSNSLIFEVDYAVYDLRSVNYNGVDPSRGADRYLYAYQVFNSGSSSLDLTSFSVLLSKGTTAGHIGYDWNKGVALGIPSSEQKFVDGSARWQFGEDGNPPISKETHSLVLMFTSNYGPGLGVVHADGMDGDRPLFITAPESTPEPATLALLCVGGVAVLRKRVHGKNAAK